MTGVFETIRIEKGRACFFDDHLTRLLAGARRLHLVWPASWWFDRALHAATLQYNGTLILRLTSEAPRFKVEPPRYSPAELSRGWRLSISPRPLEVPPEIRGLKSLNRSPYQNAADAADSADEVLLLTPDGLVAEGVKSNIFWRRGHRIFTPSPDCGILAGTTRNRIIAGTRKADWEINEGGFPLSDVLTADEAFCVNALVTAVAVISVGGRTMTAGPALAWASQFASENGE